MVIIWQGIRETKWKQTQRQWGTENGENPGQAALVSQGVSKSYIQLVQPQIPFNILHISCYISRTLLNRSEGARTVTH